MEKDYLKNGKEAKNILYSLRLPNRLLTLLKEKANAEGITLSKLIRRLLEEEIKK